MLKKIAPYLFALVLTAVGAYHWYTGTHVAGRGVTLAPAWDSAQLQLRVASQTGDAIVRIPSAQAPILAEAAPVRHGLLDLINADRRTAGLHTLVLRSDLGKVALAHTYDMLRAGYLSHLTLSGKSPYDRLHAAGIRYRAAGENIGIADGGTTDVMLQEIESAMMQSPEHRANLLRPQFRDVGIGLAQSGSRIVVTEDFTTGRLPNSPR